MSRLVHIALAGVMLAGCPRPAEQTVPGRGREARQETLPAAEDLARELEATVLENYMQLTLGNLDAYLDGMARTREVVLLGVSAPELVVGRRLRAPRGDRRLYRDLHPTLYSKTLNVHLSVKGYVGWVFDEVSYRVPYRGRQASIPVRITGVFVRDVDRWVVVQEHMSYALPSAEVLRMAHAGQLERPPPMRSRSSGDIQIDRMLDRAVLRLHNGDEEQRRRYMSAEPDALLLLPDPALEFHGEAVREAPSLASLFGPEATVELGGRRIARARTGSVAWMVADLQVKTTVNDDPVVVPLRGTYLLENRGDYGWEVVQAHVSAPLREEVISRRVFGTAEL